MTQTMTAHNPWYSGNGRLPYGWTVAADGKSISRSFVYPDFLQAFAFMRRAAIAAERWNHHPEWSNVYNRVDVRLTTHDTGGLSEKDYVMAQEMNDLSGFPDPDLDQMMAEARKRS